MVKSGGEDLGLKLCALVKASEVVALTEDAAESLSIQVSGAHDIAISGDGSAIAVVSDESHVALYDGTSGEELAVAWDIVGAEAVAMGLTRSVVAVLELPSQVRLLDGVSGEQCGKVVVDGEGCDLGLSGDGKRVAVLTSQGDVALIDCVVGQEITSWALGRGVFALDLSADGRTMAVASDAGIQVFDCLSRAPRLSLQHCPPAPHNFFSSGGRGGGAGPLLPLAPDDLALNGDGSRLAVARVGDGALVFGMGGELLYSISRDEVTRVSLSAD